MSLGEDAVEVLEVDRDDLDLRPGAAEVIETAAKWSEVFAGPTGALREKNERVAVVERLDHLVDGLPAEPSGGRAGSGDSVDQEGVKNSGREVSAYRVALPVIARRDRPGEPA